MNVKLENLKIMLKEINIKEDKTIYNLVCFQQNNRNMVTLKVDADTYAKYVEANDIVAVGYVSVWNFNNKYGLSFKVDTITLVK